MDARTWQIGSHLKVIRKRIRPHLSLKFPAASPILNMNGVKRLRRVFGTFFSVLQEELIWMGQIQPLQDLENWFRKPDPWGYEQHPDDAKRRAILKSLLEGRDYGRLFSKFDNRIHNISHDCLSVTLVTMYTDFWIC